MEQSGELLLSFRLRKFLMPDLHIYLKSVGEAIRIGDKVHRTIYEEIRKLNREYVSLYNTTRSFFEANKDSFMELVKVEKKPILLNFVPEGLYYWVLNVEYNIIDDLDRPREIGTFQIDVGNAKRFVKQGMTLLETLENAGIRADLDDRDDTMQSKVRDAELSWIPYTVIYGEKEIETKELSIRSRADSKESKIALPAFLKRIKAEIE